MTGLGRFGRRKRSGVRLRRRGCVGRGIRGPITTRALITTIRASGFALVGAMLIVVSGCMSLVAAATTPVPPLPPPTYTVGVPDEQPLPLIITEGLGAEERQDVAVYRNAVRAVVNISAVRTYRGSFGRARVGEAIGSGFILDQQAHVVTNNHVVEGASRVTVTLYDGSAYPGEVIGADSEMDLAVIRFDPLGRSLTTLSLGDSTRVQVGQRVYALGSPFGLEGTLTVGIVSGLNRPIPSESGYIMRNLIQTDASINTGNSGGPLLNSAGDIIGINVLIFSPSGGSVGVGFAIPANSARRVIESILADGRVERGWIQMSGVTVNARLAAYAGLSSPTGVLVTRVHAGGNAAEVGLRDGRDGPQIRYGLSEIPVAADIITAVNGLEVRSAVELLSLLEPTEPGDIVVLTLVRGGQRLEVQLELSERP